MTATRGEGLDGSSVVSGAAALGARLRAIWPFAGRRNELTAIAGLFDDPQAGAVYLFGPAGVGKTRLSSELRNFAEARGIPTLRIVGTATASGIPFAAVAHLLTQPLIGAIEGPIARDASHEAALLVGALQRTIREHGVGRAVVFVDDAHLLDSLSATVVASLSANNDALIIATVRLGEDLHDALTASLRSGEATRIDLHELADADVETVLVSVLGTEVELRSLTVLRSSSLGNMLYLRELVIGAVESGAFVNRNGVWRLMGPLAPSTRLRDLLAARLSNFSEGDQYAIGLLAVGGSIPIELLELLAHDADLAHLEDSGVIAVIETTPIGVPAGTRTQTEVMFAHPLFGEEVRGRVSKLRLRSIRIELADALEASGSQRSHDLLRIAVLRLDAGEHGNAQTLTRGAYLARYATDYHLTARFAGAAFAEDPSSTLGLMLGEALYEIGHFEVSAVALRSALALVVDEYEMIAIGGQLLTVLFWGVADDEATEDLVRELSNRLTVPECIGALLANRASLATFSGSPADGLELLSYLPETQDPFAYCRLAVIRSTTLSLVGRSAEGLACADKAIELHSGFAEPLLLPHPSVHAANGAFALLHGGYPEAALTRAMMGYDHAVTDRVVVSLVWCRLTAGEACVSMGRAAEALNHFEIALHDAKREHFRGQVAMAWAGIALTRALLGEVREARAAIARSDAEPSHVGAFAMNAGSARAAVFVAAGEFGSACAELQRGAELAAAGGNLIGEAWMWHELARLGMYEPGAGRLSDLAERSDNKLVTTRSAHVLALVADDASGLIAAGEAFANLGMVTLAAEALLAAASSFQRSGTERQANACVLRSASLLEGCDIAPMPNSSRTSTLTPLTAREREIAYLASEGASNKEISERLYLSSRTVENHLSRVFVKLGVSSRQGLQSALSIGGT
jgi:DNA-binding NarL/FixJ family response regulator